jgi:hypothetical protein
MLWCDRVTVATRVWGGDKYDGFIAGWYEAVKAAGFTNITAVVDEPRAFPDDVVQHVVDVSDYHYPQSGYLQRLDERITTEWVWHLDIDDRMLANAPSLIGWDADVDIWQVPIVSKLSGRLILPHRLTADEFLGLSESRWNAGSPIRMELRRKVVQPDTAWDDWGLWRALCRQAPRVGYAEGGAAYVYDNVSEGIVQDLGFARKYTLEVLEV